MAITTIPEVREEIQQNINTNNNRAITGQVLQTTLVDMLDTVDDVKANTTGYYEGMSVGLADNLISPDLTEDSDSWLYRSTAGDQDVSSGFATIQGMKGNTIVWNQQMRYDRPIAHTNVTFTLNNRVMHAVGDDLTSDQSIYAFPYNRRKLNHTYLSFFWYKSNISWMWQNMNNSRRFAPSDTWQFYCKIGTCVDSSYVQDYFYNYDNPKLAIWDFYARDYTMIDLTQMFGSDDNIKLNLGITGWVNSEQWLTGYRNFQEMFPAPYYAYDEGSLLSFNPTDIQTTGFNQYDNSKQTENVHVLADQKYRIKGTYSGLTYSDGSNVTITDGYFTPDRVDYLTLSSGNNVDTCVHLSWSGWRDPVEDYEAYWKSDTDLSWIKQIQYQGAPLFPNGLCRAGDVYDEISGGKVIKRVGSVDLGSLNWTYVDSNNRNIFWTNDIATSIKPPTSMNTINENVILVKSYRMMPQTVSWVDKDMSILYQQSGLSPETAKGTFVIVDNSYSDESTFESAMSGVMLYYELSTPIVVDLPEGINLNYRMDDFGTEEFINTTAASDTPGLCKPTLVDIGYQTNLRDKIRRLDDNYVSFTTDQTETATDAEKAQARRNIDTVDKDGTYPQMHVGLADNLVSPDGTVDTDNFIFRTTAGSQDVSSGYATLQKLEGHTIVWNQLCNPTVGSHPGVTVTNNILTVNETIAAGKRAFRNFGQFTIPSGHKYIIQYQKLTGDASDTIAYCSPSANNVRDGGGMQLYTMSANYTDGAITLLVDNLNGTETKTFSFTCYVALFDLTKMFGAGNEPSTVEAFETWLEKNVGYKEYYPYDAGSLLSVDVSGLKTVGFNQWDEEWEVGLLDVSTGGLSPASASIRSKNPIRVFPDTNYCISKQNGTMILQYCYYDASMNFISGEEIPLVQEYVTHSPNNAAYLKFANNGGGATYGNDMCVNLCWSGYRNGEYEPYWTETLNLEFIKSIEYTPTGSETQEKLFPNGLCSAGTVRDEITATKAIKRVGSVDLGSLNDWIYEPNTATPVFSVALNIINAKSSSSNMVSPMYTAKYYFWTSANEYMYVGSGGSNLNISNNSYTDAATFKTAMSGVILYYELAEPIEVAIEPEQNLNYRMDDFGTEEFVSNSESTPQTTSPYSTIKYQDNLRDKIRRMDENYVSFTVDQTESTTSEEKRQAQENLGLPAVMETKANVSGAYPQLTAGNLVADVDTPREFTFEQTGGGGTVVGNGYADVKKVEGNTIVWNQFAKPTIEGNLSTNYGTLTFSDGVATYVSNVSSGYAFVQVPNVQSHIVYLSANVKLATARDNVCMKIAGNSRSFYTTSTTEWQRLSGICTANNNIAFIIQDNATSGFDAIEITDMVFIDLTKMFGAGNEPTTVEEFERLFPMEYAPYCEGRLVSLGGYGIKWNQMVNTSTTSVTLTSGHKFYTKISGTASVVTGSGNTQATTGGTDMVCDLTMMFGPGSEPTVEEFEAMFGTQYSPYDEGTEMNILEKMELQNDLSVKSTGFNLWDEQWESGVYSVSTGQKTGTSGYIRCANFIPVLPKEEYYIKVGSTFNDFTLLYYDINRNFISYIQAGANRTYTIPANVFYITFYISHSTYNNDICINLSDPAKNGTYLPYTTSTQDLSWIYDLEYTPEGSETPEKLFPYGLLSAGTVHDEVTDTGAVKRVGVVDLGTLSFSMRSEIGEHIISSNVINQVNYAFKSNVGAICGRYNYSGSVWGVSQMTNFTDAICFYFVDGSSERVLYITANNISSSDVPTGGGIVDKLKGVLLYYELATPITVTFPTSKDLGYNVQSGGTEELLPTNPSGSGPITAPVLLSVNYPLDAVGTLTNLPRNYISVSSMDSFTTALGNFLNANITRTWDATNEKYTFTVVSRT